MKDDEKDDEDDLVEELSPSLHEESEGDVSTSVESVVPHLLGRDTSLGFEDRRGRHGVLSTDTCVNKGEDVVRR